MTAANERTAVEANFRYVQQQTKNLLPENVVLLKKLPKIAEAEKIGRKFLQCVQLGHENGFTYGDGTAFSLNDAVAGTYEEAEVDANPIVLNTKISESAFNRMANKSKFLGEGTLRTLGMYESMARRCEISMLYGQSGIAVTSSSSNVSSTSTDVTFTAASWAPGVWAGAIGAEVHFYNGASLVSSSTDAVFSVYSVNMDTRVVRFTGTATGISALDTSIGSGARDCFFRGSKSNDMLGLNAQIVGGTSFFGIDPTIYNLWQGNTHSAGSAALTMSKVLKAAAKCVARGGLTRGVLELHVSAATYTDLNLDQAALRSYDEGYSAKRAENGSDEIVYHGPGVKIVVVLNNCVKEGEAFLLPMEHIKRVGAKDIGFVSVGKSNGEDEYFRMMEGTAAYQLRMSAEFSILLDMPARACKITSIVNNS